MGAKSTVDTYQQWQEIIAPSYDDGAKKTFEGHILTDVEKTTATNKLEDNGKYTPYWNNNFLNGVNLDTDKFYTLGNPYFVYFNKKLKQPRGQINDYIINNLKFKNLRNLNSLMYFIYNSMNEIPLSVRETVKIQLNTIPVFGSFFNGFTGGMNIGFKKVSNLLIPKFNIVNFLMSAELYKFYSTVLYSKQTEKNIIPYDVFRNGTPDEIPAILGTTSHMTSFTFNLTDNIKLSTYDIDNNNIVDTKYMNLVNISQNNPNNNQQIYLLPPVEDFDLQSPIFSNDNYSGFYIDMIDILVQGKCNFKLTFYSIPNDYEGAVSDDFSIWAGTYQTVGKASGNIRLIKNNFLLANNTYSFKNKYNYPKAVNPPPPNEIPHSIFIDLSNIHFSNQYYNTESKNGMYYIGQKQSNYQSWIKDISIDITNYGYQYIKDFINDYKYLQLNLNFQLKSQEGEGFINEFNSSNPIIIDDLRNIPINNNDNNRHLYSNENDYFSYKDNIEHSGNNCKYLVYREAIELSNYYINPTLNENQYFYKNLGDTNLNVDKHKKTITFLQLWVIININENTNKINITFNFIGSLIAFTGANVNYQGEINFNNIQISPRLT
ncbi:hypothetical protein [Spiroplasma endosymbiont of Apeira syringaria]|uniref:hypothetical protein n=1 Tax=Spiroplasma endosymbiont of Apeira syringaria TaxID=3066307 RepID=UPI0030D3C226